MARQAVLAWFIVKMHAGQAFPLDKSLGLQDMDASH